MGLILVSSSGTKYPETLQRVWNKTGDIRFLEAGGPGHRRLERWAARETIAPPAFAQAGNVRLAEGIRILEPSA